MSAYKEGGVHDRVDGAREGYGHRGRPDLERWRLDLALLDRPPAPPDYLIKGLAERGSVILLAGDSGTCKSFLGSDMAIAVVHGRPWLGRSVKQGRALYIGAENSRRLTVRRLRALGLRSSDSAMSYLCRAPLILNNEDHRGALADEVQRHKPDLLVLDSALSLAGIDPNDNGLVSEFMAWVRHLAEGHDLVIVILHHENKSSIYPGRSTAAAAKAALGAMSWRGQSDIHIAMEAVPNQRETETTPEGTVVDRWWVQFKLPKERELGDCNGGDEHVVVETVRRDDTLLSAEIRSEVRGGATAPTTKPKKAPTRQRMVDALREGPLSPEKLAKAVNVKDTGGAFKTPLAGLREKGIVVDDKDGRIALAEG
jgi:archaellum biogenesis ATPase FlaH